MLKSACFMTLTCAKVLPADSVRLGWHRVQAYMMRHGYQDYLVTSAVQPKRLATYGDAVVHYHVIVLGHRRVPVEAIRQTWGLGATFHESARNTVHAIRYVASYVRGNVGRLSWSTHLLAMIPGGAAPHTDCFRYVKQDVVNGFPGGVIDFGWGGLRRVREGYDYVPSLGRIVPSVATTSHTQLWVAYRMSIDWANVRERLHKGVATENEFIQSMRLGYDVRAFPTVPLRERPILYSGG
jgi:hypothetical protein